MAIDGKINKVCCDYKSLRNKDVKMQALGGIATNLGNFKSILTYTFAALMKMLGRKRTWQIYLQSLSIKLEEGRVI